MRLKRRIAAFVVAWAYLVGYLLAFAHFVEERHAPCPEHHVQHHIAESATFVVEETDGVPRLHAGADVDDDHCQLLEFFRTSSFTIDAAPAVDDADCTPEPRSSSLAETAFDRADNSRWRYAPKQSPPVDA